MKCKRCLAQVPDDVDICPNCGQDLTALRQLLKNFYAEEPSPSSDSGTMPSQSEGAPPPPKKEGPLRKEPRVVIDSEQAHYDPGFALTNDLSMEEPTEEEAQALIWEGPRRGGFWLRSMAFAIDHLILLFTLAIFTVVGFFAAEIGGGGARDFFFYQQARIVLPVLLPLAIILFIAYFAFFHGAWGQTIGKMICGLRVVTIDGQPLSFPRALVRTIVYALSAIPFSLGFLWVGFTSSKRSWHDLIAGTMVIRE
jgi:uncharacterized RDD family membrane protein YckC